MVAWAGGGDELGWLVVASFGWLVVGSWNHFLFSLLVRILPTIPFCLPQLVFLFLCIVVICVGAFCPFDVAVKTKNKPVHCCSSRPVFTSKDHPAA